MKIVWMALSLSAQLMAQPDIYSPKHPSMLAWQKTARSFRGEDSLYDRGAGALDAGRWEDAIGIFSKVADAKGNRADGALYWKAYAQNKLGQRDASLATLDEMKKGYASSRWMDDAKALEVEVRQQAGQPVSPGTESNEDLKMLAMNSLLNTDPEQAVPLMEKVLRGNNTPKLKDRALFVLSQSRSPKAQQLLTDAAKGSFNPDLQIRALRYIATSGGNANRATLYSIYNSSNDVAVKKSIIGYFIMSKFTGAGDPLLNIAKTDKNPELRRDAIRKLGMAGTGDSGDLLVSMYGTETDSGVKHEVVNALFIQNNAKALVELAKKETRPEFRKSIVEKLSIMHSKEATQYMMELLAK
jgi:HEAT repeat protein